MFDRAIRPRGYQVRQFRESIIIDGAVCSQVQFGAPFNITGNRVSGYENEKEGTLMPALLWVLLRIEWDPLLHAEWFRTRPKRAITRASWEDVSRALESIGSETRAIAAALPPDETDLFMQSLTVVVFALERMATEAKDKQTKEKR